MTDHECHAADANMAEIARLRSELSGVRAALARQHDALLAERAARRNAEADNALLTTALSDWIASVSTARFADYDDALAKLARSLRTGAHPGAALQSELDAARTVVAALRLIDRHAVGAYETDSGSVEPCEECGEMREIASQALETYGAAMKAREM